MGSVSAQIDEIVAKIGRAHEDFDARRFEAAEKGYGEAWDELRSLLHSGVVKDDKSRKFLGDQVDDLKRWKMKAAKKAEKQRDDDIAKRMCKLQGLPTRELTKEEHQREYDELKARFDKLNGGTQKQDLPSDAELWKRLEALGPSPFVESLKPKAEDPRVMEALRKAEKMYSEGGSALDEDIDDPNVAMFLKQFEEQQQQQQNGGNVDGAMLRKLLSDNGGSASNVDDSEIAQVIQQARDYAKYGAKDVSRDEHDDESDQDSDDSYSSSSESESSDDSDYGRRKKNKKTKKRKTHKR